MIRKHSTLLAAPAAFVAALFLSGCAETAVKPDDAAPAAVAAAEAKTPPEVNPVKAADIAKLSEEDRIGLTVHFARVGDLPGLKRMLDAGAPVDGRDTLDQTALIAAVSQDSLAGVQELLKRGAKIDLVDKAGWTALHFTTFFSTETGVMDALVKAGANVNAQNDRGITALYFAAATGHEAQVKYLLAHGADREIASKNGWSPLRISKVKGLEAIADLLDPEHKAASAPTAAAPAPTASASAGK